MATRTSIETDVAIIGAGTAGLAAHRATKAAGKRALLIEGGKHGTTCARVGCMPSKLLIAPADAAHAVARFPAFDHMDRKLTRYGATAKDVDFLAERGLDLKTALANNPVGFGLDDAKRVLRQLV